MRDRIRQPRLANVLWVSASTTACAGVGSVELEATAEEMVEEEAAKGSTVEPFRGEGDRSERAKATGRSPKCFLNWCVYEHVLPLAVIGVVWDMIRRCRESQG